MIWNHLKANGPNAFFCPGFNPRKEKNNSGEIREMWKKSGVFLGAIYQGSLHNTDKYTPGKVI